jgi:hypothetical protein
MTSLLSARSTNLRLAANNLKPSPVTLELLLNTTVLNGLSLQKKTAISFLQTLKNMHRPTMATAPMVLHRAARYRVTQTCGALSTTDCI